MAIRLSSNVDRFADKAVCPECLDDPYLAELIRDNATEDRCSYCGREGEGIAAKFDLLAEHVGQVLPNYFNDPADANVAYESAEGGYQANVMSTAEALIELDFPDVTGGVVEDLGTAFGDHFWVWAGHGDFYSPQPHEFNEDAWRRFTRDVKHHQRFFLDVDAPGRDRFDEHASPIEMLRALAYMVEDRGLVTTLDSGQTLYRARVRRPTDNWSLEATHLSAPPPAVATAGRMNPTGVSYLYLAEDAETALAEVVQAAPANCGLARYRTARDLRILDLAQLPEAPSLWDPDRYHEREQVLFLEHFVEEIGKPVDKPLPGESPREHLDYVPTQVVSEFFRSVYGRVPLDERDSAMTDLDLAGINGIRYRSAARQGGVNLVLFPEAGPMQPGSVRFPQVAFEAAEWRHVAEVTDVRPPAPVASPWSGFMEPPDGKNGDIASD